jgi:CRISPR-associated endoribonuclease Cas6
MRVEIQLQSSQSSFCLPASYAYLLTSLIYRTLERSSSRYSAFLHERGYGDPKKPFKLFTFSPLLTPTGALRYENGLLRIAANRVRWQVSSPMREFVEHLAQGLLSRGEMELTFNGETQTLGIERIEVLASPVFSAEMRFTCLSPLVVSVGEERNGRFMPHYLRYDELGWSERLRANLLRKYALVQGREPAQTELEIEFDRTYLARVGEKAYKLIDFKGTKIKGVLAPFYTKGSPELIEMGYEAGFGEKNSMGFGMVAIIASGGPKKERDHVTTSTQ